MADINASVNDDSVPRPFSKSFKIILTSISFPNFSKIGVRYYQYALMFFTLVIEFVIRTALSVSIVSMTTNVPSSSDILTFPDWKNTDVILSAFFWGHVVSQIAAGKLSEYFGTKWFLFGSMTINSILNIIIPPMAVALGSTGVIICRVIQGLSQGFLFPLIQNLISRWSSVAERAQVSNFVFGGTTVGTAIAMPITGAIANSVGWSVTFYVIGGVGLLWVVIFAIFAKNEPGDHPSISEEEVRHIEDYDTEAQDDVKKLPTPWKHILTSVPVWAMLMAAAALCWGNYTLLTQIPSYLGAIMHYNIKSNGLLSSVPYICQGFLGLAISPIADKLISTNTFSITTTRKLFGGLGTFVPATALFWLAFIDSSQYQLAVVLLVVAVAFLNCIFYAYMVNAIDLAPTHAKTIVGFINGITSGFSILGPMSVGWIGTDKTDPTLWKTVFLVAADILVLCGLFYMYFASAELQDWDSLEESHRGLHKIWKFFPKYPVVIKGCRRILRWKKR